MIAAFVVEQMGRYIAGGMNPATAGRFTRGELAAIYKGDHRSRDTSGTMRVTPPLEALDAETAMKKCDAALKEILNYCAQSAEKGSPLDTGIEKAETQGTAPENTPRAMSGAAKKSGLEGLKNYVKGNTA